MNKKIVIAGIIIVAISFFISSIQNSESDVVVEKIMVDFDSSEWNNEVTKILPKQSQAGKEWMPLWSDGSNMFVQGEMPITNTKKIGNSEITSTSYNYQNHEIGTIQIFVWKGEWVSEWDHENAVNTVLQQVDGVVEKMLKPDNLSAFCTMGYYDLYGKEDSKKNDLLFSECSKDNYRIRINLSEGKYSEKSIESVIMFSNQVVEQIK